MIDLRLALMCGTDIPIEECQLVIHQPTLKEIALIGEQEFLIGVQTFCIQKNMLLQEDKGLLSNTNNFQIFMTIMSQPETADKKKAVQNIFNLFFPTYKILITPRSLIFTQEGQDNILIDENNFDYIQNMVSQICCLKNGLGGQENFNPANAKAREIAEKLMRGRQRAAAQNGDSNNSIFVQYISILTIGIGSMSLQDIINLTMYQLYDLVERYTLYVNWDLDVRTRLAGGKPDSKPDNWMKDLH